MKDIQWSFISLATASIAHLLLRIVLGRELGPSGLGLYTLVFTIYMFGMQFAAFGIGAALTKYIAQYHDDQTKIREFVTAGIAGSLVSGTVMGILLYLFSDTISIQFFHIPEMTDLLKITAFCFPFIAMQKAVIGTLNGLRLMKLFAVVNIVQNMSVLVITVVLVLWLNMDVKGAVIGFVLSTLLVGLLSLAFVRDYFTTSPKLVHTVLKEISWFGFYVVLANSIGMVIIQIDSLLIGYFMNETEVGYYAVAIVFTHGITLLPQAVQRVTTPSIATYYGKRDFKSIRSLIRGTMIKMLLVAIAIAIILAFFGKTLIGIIFTEEYIPAYAPLLILLIGYSIYASFISVGTCLSSIGKVQIVFRISALCAILNTLLNIGLIPQFGLVGAASATSISLIFTTLINLYFMRRYIAVLENQTQ
ncbi:MAG: Membrane protein involved in the export of O-antigen and teichoic acid [Candidatus Methanomarinus sp.]|nr:MAG: Membrane protein involved in the export of O-antigen and teichoic acid [ANME-2 cluster archaeon]